MSLEMLIILGILIITVILFTTDVIRVDVVALAVVASLALSGILTPEEALSGFSNPVVITMAALFIVGGGITQTGLADYTSRRILSFAGSQ